MGVTRADIVAEARTWMGTRWHHQAHVKGVGCDCGGLVRGVGWNLRLLKPLSEYPGSHEFNGYSRMPSQQKMERACAALLEGSFPFAQAKPGDIVLMAWNSPEPNHVGIITDLGAYPGLIHAWAAMRKVVESRLDAVMIRRIVGAYRYPGVEA